MARSVKIGSTKPTSPRLHEILSLSNIAELHEIFLQEAPFTREKLRNVLDDFDIFYPDEVYDRVFSKINVNRDNLCCWDEFVSHLLLGLRIDDPFGQKETLNLPIEDLPVVRKSIHKFPIVRIRFSPTVKADRSSNFVTGSYITASKEGTLIYWNQGFQYQRTGKSKSPTLKVAKTWILDFICLPDVRVVCTSSIERELRFYDTTANNFSLRIIVSSLPYAVNAMHYWFGETTDVDCKIVLGDFAGNVMLLEFCPELRGPFQSKTSSLLQRITWKQLLAGWIPLMKVTVFNKLHLDTIRQIEYSDHLNAIISCAECRNIPVGHVPAPGVVISELGVQKYQTILRMSKGVTSFDFDPISELIVTGGPDCLLRIWNHIVPKKPIAILPGHSSGIIYIFIQDGGKKVYSVDRTKIVKIWDLVEHTIIQTYIAIGAALPDRAAINCLYNDYTRELVIVSLRIATVKCCPLLNLDLSDGYTHARQISVLLFNELFEVIVTCGLDSYIIIWNPFTGQRLKLIKEAHTRTVHGEIKRVEITAGCFDPKYQLLLTGARDGTLKVWNYNDGVCIRNMSIDHMCEVTSVYWVKDRLLAAGWNKKVTEFFFVTDDKQEELKCWDSLHDDDISCICASEPYAFATASYGGELILWKLETGQAYQQCNVENPTVKIKIAYDKKSVTTSKNSKFLGSFTKMMKFLRSPSDEIIYSRRSILNDNEAMQSPKFDASTYHRKLSIVQIPSKLASCQAISVHTALFLCSRPVDPAYGSLVVAIELGVIQFYSHHHLGKFISNFNAIHMSGDCIVKMCTDKQNRFLFTGSAHGYIKTWVITNFCVPPDKQQHINLPELRNLFPFLHLDRWTCRAKRTLKVNHNPMLVNSYKAHLLPVTGIVYVDKSQLLISSSSDYTCRIWTLSGRYIGTLGSPLKWTPLSTFQPVPENYGFRFPPDIARVGSSTTIKIIKGAQKEDIINILRIQKRTAEADIDVPQGESYGERLPESMLGKHLTLPDMSEEFELKKKKRAKGEYIPVYQHLVYHKAGKVETPRTPEYLNRCKGDGILKSKKRSNTNISVVSKTSEADILKSAKKN